MIAEVEKCYLVTIGDTVKTLKHGQALELHAQLGKLLYPVENDVMQVKGLLARHFQVSLSQIDSHARTRPVLWARWMAMWICRQCLGLSCTQIAQQFGGRDPSGMTHVFEEVQRRIETRPVFARELEFLTEKLVQSGLLKTPTSSVLLERPLGLDKSGPGSPSGQPEPDHKGPVHGHPK